MNYEQALAYIHGTLKFGSKLGLENIRNLLEFMDNPHKKLRYIHVAGTNGKGSTTAMIASILKQAGYRVGTFISPYIERFTERIRINDEDIPQQRLADITTNVRSIVQKMVEKGYTHPTEFEIVAAIAFQYFYEEKCDYVVLEVGLGGRFDATNVIDTSLVSVITSISMDHMDVLGDTIEKIAFEKSGIIKEKGLVVVYPNQHPDALQVIRRVAEERNAEVTEVDYSDIHIISAETDETIFNFKNHYGLKIHLLGKHQVLNAATAITAIELIKKKYNIRISEKDIKAGLRAARWPGRFEIIGRSPLFVIDGAHNESGVDVLEECLDQYFPGKNITLIAGMLRDKEYSKCIKKIAPKASLFIATCPLSERAAKAEEIGNIAKKYCNRVIIKEDFHEAVKAGLELTKEDDVVCCFGSLYLIGAVRKIFTEVSK